MTEPFKASNGIEITMETDGGGDVYLVGRRDRGDDGQHLDTYANAGPEGIVALRELFQHERDESLGRWRWPEQPEWVVYPDSDGVVVLNEKDPSAGIGQTRLTIERYPTSYGATAAGAYFEAHPERKPWEDAKTGEVWLIGSDTNEIPAIVTDGGLFRFADGSRIPATELFVTARRIWPEDAS